MKLCPECRRNYYDDSLSYCLEDGTVLVQGSVPAPIEPPTAILHETSPPAEAATVPAIHTTQRTEVLPLPGAVRTSRIDWRLLAALGVGVIVLAGYFGYQYLRPQSVKQIESIAVMPFVNDSGNADVEYLSDGMTETLIGSLSQLPNLAVKARSSVFRYKGKEIDLRKIASELNVHAILSGRVAALGEQLILNLELVDAQTENVIWSERYQRKASELASLQGEIARDVSNKLRSKLSGAQQNQIAKNYTANTEAYQLYLKGRYYWNKRTQPDIKRSIEYFNEAIAIDPAFAIAYAGLADAYQVLPGYAEHSREDIYPKAWAAAQKALEIDPALAEPHATLGAVLHEYEWKFEEAEKEFKRAIELNPNYASAHQWYGEYLMTMGRAEEAISEMQLAQQLDPLSLIINTMVGRAYFSARRYDAAIAHLQKTLEIDPNFRAAHDVLAEAYFAKGMFEEAIEERRRSRLIGGAPPERVESRFGALKEAYRKFGARGFWEKSMQFEQENAREKNREMSSLDLAYYQIRMGNQEKALDLLEKAVNSGERGRPVISLKEDPAWDPIRPEPRFQEVLKRIGLPQCCI